MPVEALLLPLRMPLFCSFEIIALVGCGISRSFFVYDASEDFSRYSSGVMPVCFLKVEEKYIGF